MKSVLVMLAASVLVACSDVPSGYVGIKVNLLGGDKGVDTQELGTGRYWIGMNEQLYTFPTFSQNQVWTKDKNEGSPNDDSVSFQTADGLEVNTDIGISYHIDPTMVSVVFQKYRKGIDEITNVYIRSAVRNALVNAASTKKIETVYGAGKSELLSEVKLSVKQQCVEFGIVIDEVYWIGTFRLPPSIITSINDKATASQKTQQREQEIQQSRAEADKKIEEARGEAEAILLKANAESTAIKLKGDALNQNPRILELIAIERWNGTLPTTMIPGASTPFVNVK